MSTVSEAVMKRSLTIGTLATLGLLLASVGHAQTAAPAGTAAKVNAQQPAVPTKATTTKPAAATTKPAAATTTKPVATSSGKTSLLDLNTATREQLVGLPGIGETYADAIIKARPFKSRSELVSKKIVPQSAYKQFRTMVTAKHSA
jgi:competence protein ComEA